MQKKTVVAKHVVLFALVFLTTSASQAASKQSLTLNDLTDRADVIMVAKILRTDYSRTGVDGPMIATAKVIKCIKGKFSPGNTFDFAETGWWGPDYKEEETIVSQPTEEVSSTRIRRSHPLAYSVRKLAKFFH